MKFLNQKKILIIPEYPFFLDPPTKNLYNYLLDFGCHVTILSQGVSKFNLNQKNLLLKSVPEVHFYKRTIFVKFINILFRFISIRIFTKYNYFNYVFLYQYKNIALYNSNKNKNWIPIITDIHGTINIGKFDLIFRWLALKKLEFSTIGWVSDEYKLDLLKLHSNRELINFKVLYNCPRLSYLSKFKNLSKSQLRLELSDSGFHIGRAEDIVITRAGGNVKFGGIEETIVALKEVSENIKFVIIGKCDRSFEYKITNLIDHYSLGNRVFFYGFVEDEIYEKIIAASDFGHLVHLKPFNDFKLLDNYNLNSSLSNNRLFQYLAAGVQIISYKDYRLNEIHKEFGVKYLVDTESVVNSLIFILKSISSKKCEFIDFEMSMKSLFEAKYNFEKQFRKLNLNIE
jgi:glycosyltransferase involved in cell wall biosynthesis